METVSEQPKVWTRVSASGEKRDVWTALRRGFRGRCPRCGQGRLFRAFLKVADHCSVCGLDFTPHRADDLPAYLVIVIVGHIVVPTILWIETDYSPSVPLLPDGHRQRHPAGAWHRCAIRSARGASRRN